MSGEGDDSLTYALCFRAASVRPGRHAGRQMDGDGVFRRHVPFWQQPDARRIDLRRSLSEPFGRIVVRVLEQRAGVAVFVVGDLSLSMNPNPAEDKLAMLAQLVSAVGRAAERSGDAFGFVGFDDVLPETFRVPPTRRRGTAAEIARKLAQFQPAGRSIDALASVADNLGSRPRLVLLASDFHAPLNQIERGFEALSRHDVVPVILRSAAEEAPPPAAGVLRMRDAETGASRLLWMRPSLQKAWLEARQARQAALERLFGRFGRSPFLAPGRLDLASLSEHLVAA